MKQAARIRARPPSSDAEGGAARAAAAILATMAIVGAVGLLSIGTLALPFGAATLFAHHPTSPHTAPFQVALPIPPVLTPARTTASADFYQVTMRPAQMQILPGLSTTIWGYEGMFPGPTIKARSGRPTYIRQINNLPAGTSASVHLHGGHSPAAMDGHPNDLIPPGGSRDYGYPNRQLAATLWYHDHADMLTGEHLYRGLAGFYLLQDSVELGLPLPSGAYDVPLLIQDRIFNADGSLYYPPMTGQHISTGLQGDTILVNGAVQPYFQVANRKYRVRFLNGSNARMYELALSTERPFIQIATDGGLAPAPVRRTSLPIMPGERIEAVIDFAEYSIGSMIVLKNRLGLGSTEDVLRFDVVRSETDDSSVPSTLRPYRRLDPSQAVVNRSFTLTGSSTGWFINGLPYDQARIDATPTLNTTEVWEFVNNSLEPHPMHLHGVQVQVIERNGAPPPVSWLGWKDVYLVLPGERIKFVVRFTDHLGTYIFHCHILEHEDHGMMAQYQVVP